MISLNHGKGTGTADFSPLEAIGSVVTPIDTSGLKSAVPVPPELAEPWGRIHDHLGTLA